MTTYWNWSKHCSRKETEKFLVLFTTLMENGFSLQESLAVITRTGQFRLAMIEKIQTQLALGLTLEEALSGLKLSVIERNQLRLAEEHGNLLATLSSICQVQKLMGKQKQLLQKVMTYPLLLLVFVAAALLGMRSFLLPQLLISGMVDTEHWGIRMIQEMPRYVGIFSGILILIFAGVILGLSRQDALRRASFCGKFPFLGSFYQIYHTSFFALEWGRLFRQGLELHQIIQCMTQTKEGTLMALFAQELDQELKRGGSLSHKLTKYPFLTKEFPLIVFQGEVKGKLGDELFIYSQLLLEQLFQRVEQVIQWVQPVIFLLIALLIVGIYAAMFLPIYGNIQGVI